MKVFNLQCAAGHPFEGWFASTGEFDRQHARGLLTCPVCDSHDVRRLPSAPRLNAGAKPPPPADAGAQRQRALRELAERFTRAVVESTEDVGTRFAEEARRIHYDEAPARAIRGQATARQADELRDEGIDVTPLPFPVVPKSSLQ